MPKDLRSGELFRTADALAEQVFRRTSGWGASDKHTMGAQLCRAALSVACNLVESTSRASARERHRFVEIADGSLREARYVLELASRLGAFDAATAERLRGLAERATLLMRAQRSRARAKVGPRRRRRRRQPRAPLAMHEVAAVRADSGDRQTALDLAPPDGQR